MPRVFISYRRDDTADFSGRLRDRLAAQFGSADVFLDLDTIPLGEDFRRHMLASVKSCDVMLAVIGPRWLEGGRIKSPGDYVRAEIAVAFANGVPVLPVLVDGASPPRVNDVPRALAALSHLNGAVFPAGGDFRLYADRLADHIEQIAERRKQQRQQRSSSSFATVPVIIAIAVAVCFLLLLVFCAGAWALVHDSPGKEGTTAAQDSAAKTGEAGQPSASAVVPAATPTSGGTAGESPPSGDGFAQFNEPPSDGSTGGTSNEDLTRVTQQLNELQKMLGGTQGGDGGESPAPQSSEPQ